MLALPLALLQRIGPLATFQGCHESTNRLTLRLQVKKPIEGTKLWLVGEGVPVVGCTQNRFEAVDMVGWNHGTTKVLIYLNLVPERNRSRVEFFDGMCLLSNIWRKSPQIPSPLHSDEDLKDAESRSTRIYKQPMTRPVINNRNPGSSRGIG